MLLVVLTLVAVCAYTEHRERLRQDARAEARAEAREDNRVYTMMANCMEQASDNIYADRWNDLDGWPEQSKAIGCMQRRVAGLTNAGRISAGWSCHGDEPDYGGCYKDGLGFSYGSISFGLEHY